MSVLGMLSNGEGLAQDSGVVRPRVQRTCVKCQDQYKPAAFDFCKLCCVTVEAMKFDSGLSCGGGSFCHAILKISDEIYSWPISIYYCFLFCHFLHFVVAFDKGKRLYFSR